MATHKGSSGSVKVAASGGTEAVVGEVRSYSIEIGRASCRERV